MHAIHASLLQGQQLASSPSQWPMAPLLLQREMAASPPCSQRGEGVAAAIQAEKNPGFEISMFFLSCYRPTELCCGAGKAF